MLSYCVYNNTTYILFQSANFLFHIFFTFFFLDFRLRRSIGSLRWLPSEDTERNTLHTYKRTESNRVNVHVHVHTAHRTPQPVARPPPPGHQGNIAPETMTMAAMSAFSLCLLLLVDGKCGCDDDSLSFSLRGWRPIGCRTTFKRVLIGFLHVFESWPQR